MKNCLVTRLKAAVDAPLPRFNHVQIAIFNKTAAIEATNSIAVYYASATTAYITNGHFVDSDLVSNPTTSKVLNGGASELLYFVKDNTDENAYIEIPYDGLRYIGGNGTGSSNIVHNYLAPMSAFKYCSQLENYQISGDPSITGDLSEFYDSALRAFAITRTAVTGNVNEFYQHRIDNGLRDMSVVGIIDRILNTKVIANGGTWPERSKYRILNISENYYRFKVINISNEEVSDWEYNKVNGVWVGTDLLNT